VWLALTTPWSVPHPAQGADRASQPSGAENGVGDNDFQWHVLVPGPERIKMEPKPSGSVVLTGRNPEHLPIDTWNRRQAFTERRTDPSINETVCATWARQSEAAMQQGLAVRVLGGPGDRQRAVTLTKNTFAGYYWVFNLLTWDTRRTGDPWRYVAQFDMSDVVVRDGQWVPLPWRTCLRVHGRTVSFKVWLPNEEPEPAWHNSTHSRRAILPARFVYPGRPGWYIGHLRAGQTTEYSALTS
jgi:hypothetical protein